MRLSPPGPQEPKAARQRSALGTPSGRVLDGPASGEKGSKGRGHGGLTMDEKLQTLVTAMSEQVQLSI